MYSARARLWASRHPRTIRLASILWNIYRRVALRQRQRLSPSAYKLLHECLSAYKAFKNGNDPKKFMEAITSFRKGLSIAKTKSGGITVLIGWGCPEFIDELVTFLRKHSGSAAKIRVRRFVFRPDTLLMSDSPGNPFCGFRIRVTQDQEVLPFDGDFPFSGNTGAVESVAMTEFSHRGQFLGYMASHHLDALVELLDWTNEAQTAKSLLAHIPSHLFGTLAFSAAAPWLKMSLIAGDDKGAVADGVYPEARVLEIKNPPWVSCESIETRGQFDPSSPVCARYSKLKDVSVFSGGTVISENTLWNIDCSSHPALDFVAGRHDHVVGSLSHFKHSFVRISEPAGIAIKEGILLTSRVDSNWFHWLIETLPRLTYVEKIIDPNIPVIINSRIPGAAKESLRFLTRRPVFEIEAEKVSRISSAIIPGSVIFHPDSAFYWDSELLSIHNRAALGQVRETVLSQIEIDKAGSKKIYLSRGVSSRNLINRSQVRRWLNKNGFTEVDTTIMGFSDQVETLHLADVIILEGGAGMANLIFCNPNAKVLILVGEEVKNYEMPVLLGSVAGASVRVLAGKLPWWLKHRPLIDRIHSPYRIEKKELLRTIREFFN